MMNKLQLFIFLVCICMLAGCTEEEENSGIRLIEGTAPGQTIFADETTTDGDIHFTTDGAKRKRHSPPRRRPSNPPQPPTVT